MSHLSDGATLVAVLAAGLAGLIYLGQRARTAMRAIEALQRVVSHELTHNHGTSIKDDTYGIAVSTKQISDAVDELRTGLSAIVADGLEALREDLTEVRERLDRIEAR